MHYSNELADLFDKATLSGSPEDMISSDTTLYPLPVVSNKLDELLNLQIPNLFRSAILVEKHKAITQRVDGRIIGTGEADFTKGNTLYTLKFKDKIFQLIDVPGIEGNENKYANMVREAVAKAHLVFYVNGTNKKPEKATAEKIRSYLRHGTQVCPLVNIRGSADAYEFTEDRESLENHGGASAALKQTIDVLDSVLGKDVLLSGHCIQGLVAFSSLAMNSKSRITTIHPSRDRDLVIQQRNYLKYFGSSEAMYEFSQLQEIAQVLNQKQDTFKEDIIESNKIKVRELLSENIDTLEKAYHEHEVFINRVEPEFTKCRESVNEALKTFERLIIASRKNAWENFFNRLIESADDIVAENFGDKDSIESKLKNVSQAQQNQLSKDLQVKFEEQIQILQESLTQAMERLIQDIQRVELQNQISFNPSNHKHDYSTGDLDMDLGFKDWGAILFNIGSYGLTGAGIGSAFPVIGTAIGAAIGVLLGLLLSFTNFFMSKEKRIRKAQAQVQEKINEVRNQVISKLSEETNSVISPVQAGVKDISLRQIESIFHNISRPLFIIKKQIALMTNIKKQLEDMSYGTIKTIQY